MEKRYNLLTAIAMVVGTVIGSGVFFKAEVVLKNTGGPDDRCSVLAHHGYRDDHLHLYLRYRGR